MGISIVRMSAMAIASRMKPTATAMAEMMVMPWIMKDRTVMRMAKDATYFTTRL
ncbi:MAG: hypothetical protein FWB80_06630 [Defluviitaleaceae bacterium]|nr:hypothetical protein [Defluviitaleaceae bacterium]